MAEALDTGVSVQQKAAATQQAAKGLKDYAYAAQGGIGAVKQATAAGRAQILQQSGAGLAASVGSGVPAGGGQAALARQSALESGNQLASFGASQAQAETQARMQAAQAGYESGLATFELPTAADQTVSQIAEIRDFIDNTPPKLAATSLEAMYAAETDPAMKGYILDELGKMGAYGSVQRLKASEQGAG
jgi:hypothetical protein